MGGRGVRVGVGGRGVGEVGVYVWGEERVQGWGDMG